MNKEDNKNKQVNNEAKQKVRNTISGEKTIEQTKQTNTGTNKQEANKTNNPGAE